MQKKLGSISLGIPTQTKYKVKNKIKKIKAKNE